MRSVVCAYGAVGHSCLEALLEVGAEVVLVLSHEDSPGENIWFPSVSELARAHGIEVLTPTDVNESTVLAAVATARPDFLFSFYFRQMMGKPLLDLPTLGALNLHGSYLPRFRGRAPVNWVLVQGETETGVTLHYMDEKPDHGDIVLQRRIPIDPEDTALVLTRRMAETGSALVREAYPLLETGRAPRRPQEHALSTYFGGRGPADGLLVWDRPAESLRNLVRAVTAPWPGAFTTYQGSRLLVWKAAVRPGTAEPGRVLLDPEGIPLVGTGTDLLELCKVGWRDSPGQSGASWVKAAAITDGARFDGWS